MEDLEKLAQNYQLEHGLQKREAGAEGIKDATDWLTSIWEDLPDGDKESWGDIPEQIEVSYEAGYSAVWYELDKFFRDPVSYYFDKYGEADEDSCPEPNEAWIAREVREILRSWNESRIHMETYEDPYQFTILFGMGVRDAKKDVLSKLQ